MSRLLAQIPLGDIEGIGPLSDNAHAGSVQGVSQLTSFISNAIALLSIIGSLWFIFQIILAAIQWIGGGGDKQTLDTARKRLTNAVMGLFLVITAFTLVGIIGRFVGINIYLFDDAILLLTP